MVCSLGIDLQSPADTFHFLCSLCASLILRVCCAIARATWVDEWWRPLVNIAPYMCHRPKEPTSWTSVLSLFFFSSSPSYSLLTYPPHSSSYLFTPPPPNPHSIFLLSLPSFPPFSIYPPLRLFFIATAPPSRQGWDHFSSLLLCTRFLRDRATGGRVENVKH